MKTFLRILEVSIGLVFLLGAAAKALDIDMFAIQIRHYGIDLDIALLRWPAMAMTLLEAVLAACLIGGIRLRGWAPAFTMALLVFLSGLIAYGWAFHGLKDCGCFGKFMATTPGPSILKNVVMITILGAVFWKVRKGDLPDPGRGVRIVLATLSTLVFAGSAVFAYQATPANAPIALSGGTQKDAPPFARFVFENDGQRFDLGTGTHFVAMLSATCDHCMGQVPAINDLSGFPECPVVALMLGSEEELAAFKEQTSPAFPTQLIDKVEFFRLFSPGEAPPKFYLVKDGTSVKSWKDTAPGIEELMGLLTEEPAAPASAAPAP